MSTQVDVGESGCDTDHSTRYFITPGFRWGFVLVASLFFLWAIANNFNDILVHQFQGALALNRAQAGLIQFVFYIGYFTMALPAGLLMRRWGYKTGILIGLGLYAAGAMLFYPAADIRTYGLFLAALYVIALGAALLETAANPFVIAFGDRHRAAQRLNFAQAFNGLGGFIAPIIGGIFIFSGANVSSATLASMPAAQRLALRVSQSHAVRMPYLVLAGVVILLALAVALTRLPETRPEHPSAALAPQMRALGREPALRGAVLAQFFYVGAQVGVWSFFVDFALDVTPGISARRAAFLLSASLALFMIGRFSGSALMQRVRPERLLMLYAAANVLLCAVAIGASHELAIGALMLTSFFMSIMYPTIFSLGVQDLGELTPLGSSFIVMAIIGGAVVPPLMGVIATAMGTTHYAMALPLACFLVVGIYARRVARSGARTIPG
ncbi:MAG TPA: L-fucose:H+ symporter permease [Steroidobacteraceae bacterium]|nr:L-fucose:H+ symporter permease [Steroidobacteraceae bacterium]